MSNVKSTYNFVPAPTEDQVYKPEWANKVSHDIPFEDGESGEIELSITAETPIFIKEGISKIDAQNKLDNKASFEFSHYFDKAGKKHYFIPATSLKGMFRNVLEILSFSRLNKNLVNSLDKFSYRDITSAQSSYLQKFKNLKINAGWLSEDALGNWIIDECESFAFIDHEELKDKGFPFRDKFLNKTPGDKEKSGVYKYAISKELKLEWKFRQFEKTLFGGVIKKMAAFEENGIPGKLVFTGQASKRDESRSRHTGKFHEFVFFNGQFPPQIVDKSVQNEFKFIYGDHDSRNISEDWKYWRNNFLEKNKKVPVFFCKDANNNIIHMGLTYMYKLPYKNSIGQMLPFRGYNYAGLDLATTIFGYSNANESLKGRVYFSNALSVGAPVVSTEKNEILGGPRASYFPFYLEQYKIEGDKKDSHKNTLFTREYNTYDDNVSLKGFKRYPIRGEARTGIYDEKQQKNDVVFSRFSPLKEGSKFSCKIRFHNLKKIEIGALISSFTFHGQKSCFHNIGLGKSFGYGKVSIIIEESSNLSDTPENYMIAFQEEMIKCNSNWINSPALKELIAMSSNDIYTHLEFPTMKEYQDYKKKDSQWLSLPYHSEVMKENGREIKLRMLKKKSDLQNMLDYNTDNFTTLTNQIISYLEDFDSFSDENRKLIYSSIVKIYQTDKESKKKLSKKIIFWQKVIPGWIGNEMTNQLMNEIGLDIKDFH